MADDVVEKIEVPAHNKDCENCLDRALHIAAVHKAAQMLSGNIHLVKTSVDDLTQKQQLLSDRIDALEHYKRDAETAAAVSQVWLKVVTGIGAGVVAVIYWWISKVQNHLDTFGK